MNRCVLFLLAGGLIGCGTRSSEVTPVLAESTAANRDVPPKIEPRLANDLPREPERIMGSVNGLVSLDGQPLATGTITCLPQEAGSKSPTLGAPIKDGKYSIEKVPSGTYKVSISSKRVVGKKTVYDKPDSPSVDDTVEVLPARYNEKTLFTATVREGANTLNFDLTSK